MCIGGRRGADGIGEERTAMEVPVVALSVLVARRERERERSA
jgi:hypothetical protein